MSARAVASVVEGRGEVEAVPLLLRRLAADHDVYDLDIHKPHRAPRHRLVSHGPRPGADLERILRLHETRVGADGLIIVLVDGDDDDTSDLYEVLGEAVTGLTCSVLPAVAQREYEAWLLAAATSLRSHRAVLHDASYQDDPEQPRDAKGALAKLMTEPYRPTVHQPALTQIMSLGDARRARQFSAFSAGFSSWLHGTDHPRLHRPGSPGGD